MFTIPNLGCRVDPHEHFPHDLEVNFLHFQTPNFQCSIRAGSQRLLRHAGLGIIIDRQRLASDLRLRLQQSHLPEITHPSEELHQETYCDLQKILQNLQECCYPRALEHFEVNQ